MISKENKEWTECLWNKLKQKFDAVTPEIGVRFPHTTVNGKYENFAKDNNINYWTNGFWPGIMWLMYSETKSEMYKDIAEKCEVLLDKALYNFDELLHDVGFMWSLSAVADYRLTGSYASRQRGLLAASVLSARYNMKSGIIRAWNPKELENYAIIDCMMNLPLLYWASEATDDKRFSYIAQKHADSCMNKIVRPDGSSNHIVEFDPETGDVLSCPYGQGYASGSSWSRGQSWAIYGFVLSYIYTKKQEYLDTAKKAAHYFMFCMPSDGIPDSDFRAPENPVYKDASAAAIAACGMIEISKYVGEYERRTYLNNAIKLLKGIEPCCDFSNDNMAILNMCSSNYGAEHYNVIWGDFFLLEAVLKLRGNEFLIW